MVNIVAKTVTHARTALARNQWVAYTHAATAQRRPAAHASVGNKTAHMCVYLGIKKIVSDLARILREYYDYCGDYARHDCEQERRQEIERRRFINGLGFLVINTV